MGKVIKIQDIMKLVEKRYDKGKISHKKLSQYTDTCGSWIKELDRMPIGQMVFYTEL